eukprot:1160942-Pelagomonas_calceolata.AAC.5
MHYSPRCCFLLDITSEVSVSPEPIHTMDKRCGAGYRSALRHATQLCSTSIGFALCHFALFYTRHVTQLCDMPLGFAPCQLCVTSFGFASYVTQLCVMSLSFAPCHLTFMSHSFASCQSAFMPRSFAPCHSALRHAC